MSLWIVFPLLFGAVVCPGNHHTECKDDCASTLLSLVTNYSEHICHSIQSIKNCGHLHLPHDINETIYEKIEEEQVCGTDGITYENHCTFAQAHCAGMYPHHNDPTVDIQLANYGPCVAPTSSTQQPVGGSTSQPVAATTVHHNNMHDLMAGVFCANKDIIACVSDITLVCANDGQFYPNMVGGRG